MAHEGEQKLTYDFCMFKTTLTNGSASSSSVIVTNVSAVTPREKLAQMDQFTAATG